MAKRKEIAAKLRAEATGLNGREKALRQMESLYYEADPATRGECLGFVEGFANEVKALTGSHLEEKKGEVTRMNGALNYLIKAKVLPADFAPKAMLTEVIKAQGWDKRR